MTIKLRLVGLSEAVGTLDGLPERMNRSVIRQLSQVAYDDAYKGAARHSKTGAMLQSLYNRSVPNGRAIGHDLARAPQAEFVNLGTRAHKIRPRNKKALRWVSGGKFIFARGVNHPGYRGDGYLFNAASVALRQFSSIVDAALRESR